MMPLRYLVTLIDGGGNVPPELGAVRRLVERGHDVTVLAEDSVAPEACATGASVRPWTRAPNRASRRPEDDPCRDWECTYPWQLVDRLCRTLMIGPAERYAQDVAETLPDVRPALIISSMFCVGGMVAAERAGIPFTVLFPNIYPLPAPGLPPFGIGLRPARGVMGRLRDRTLNGMTERLWDAKGLELLNALRRGLGLEPLAHVFDQVRRARRQLVLTSPDFDFPATLSDTVRYVGPVLDDPPWADAAPWTPPAGMGPLVLVAMSTTFQDQIECLQRVIDALGRLPVRAVVTTGPAIDPAALRAPANVTIVASAPHRRVMREAALVVTHAGHGTVMKALAAGVPMVMMPHGRDQADTAIRVTERGAGITLGRTAHAEAIAGAIKIVLEQPSYRAAARRLGEIVRRDESGTTLILELETLAGGHP